MGYKDTQKYISDYFADKDRKQLEKELFVHVHTLENPTATQKEQDAARKAIANTLTALSKRFEKNKYVLGEDFSIIDVALAPLLWRLEHYEIKLG